MIHLTMGYSWRHLNFKIVYYHLCIVLITSQIKTEINK